MRKLLRKLLSRKLFLPLLLLLLLALPTTALADATPIDDETLAVVTPADDENVDEDIVTPVPPEVLPDDDTENSDNAENTDNENETVTPPAPLPDKMEVWLFDYDINANRRTEVVPVNLSLDGRHLPSDVPAMAISGRTLVPVRLISENLQAQVVWEKATNTVTITQDGQTIILTIGSNTALINGVETPVPGDVSVSLVTHEQIARTMVPVRFVSENLGATINYQQAERNVDIIPPVVEEPEDEPSPPPPGIDDDGSLYRRVVIDAGHGGKDPGTNGGALIEKDITLTVALLVQDLLEDADYEVIMSRTEDEYPELMERAKLTQEYDAPIFVSIHCNAAENIASANGIETYIAPADAADADLAAYLQAALIDATSANDRGVKESRLVVLTQNPAPACLVELGFMTNPDECAKLGDEDYQQTLAEAIANGIDNYFADYAEGIIAPISAADLEKENTEDE